jgi:hypothetical protein
MALMMSRMPVPSARENPKLPMTLLSAFSIRRKARPLRLSVRLMPSVASSIEVRISPVTVSPALFTGTYPRTTSASRPLLMPSLPACQKVPQFPQAVADAPLRHQMTPAWSMKIWPHPL